MKRIISTLSLISLLVMVGQSQSLTGGCFDEYTTLFKIRGAKFVTDGDQKIVLATRGGDNLSHCFMGKVTVKNGEIIFPVSIEKEDGTFEIFKTELTPAFKTESPTSSLKIEGGKTITFRTTENDLVKIFFISFLEAKPKANKIAPSAKSFLK